MKYQKQMKYHLIEFTGYFFEGMNTFTIFSLPIHERDPSLHVSDYLCVFE